MSYLKNCFQYYKQTLFYVVFVFILMIGLIIYLLFEIEDREQIILVLKIRNIELESHSCSDPNSTIRTYRPNFREYETWDYEQSERYFRRGF